MECRHQRRRSQLTKPHICRLSPFAFALAACGIARHFDSFGKLETNMVYLHSQFFKRLWYIMRQILAP